MAARAGAWRLRCQPRRRGAKHADGKAARGAPGGADAEVFVWGFKGRSNPSVNAGRGSRQHLRCRHCGDRSGPGKGGDHDLAARILSFAARPADRADRLLPPL